MRVKYDFNSNAWTIPILAMLFVNSPTHNDSNVLSIYNPTGLDRKQFFCSIWFGEKWGDRHHHHKCKKKSIKRKRRGLYPFDRVPISFTYTTLLCSGPTRCDDVVFILKFRLVSEKKKTHAEEGKRTWNIPLATETQLGMKIDK